MVHLHTRSWFSFRAGGSSPEALAEAAADQGAGAAALTDRHGVCGAVRFQRAYEAHGIHLSAKSGETQDHVNRLKLLNRQVYG